MHCLHADVITGPLNGPVLFCSLASVVGRRRLSGYVTLLAGGPAGCRARGQSAHRSPSASAVRRPTLHGGPVRLRLVRATPCWFSFRKEISVFNSKS